MRPREPVRSKANLNPEGRVSRKTRWKDVTGNSNCHRDRGKKDGLVGILGLDADGLHKRMKK
jgi:hypothetical protein